jgi:hypothetical protein
MSRDQGASPSGDRAGGLRPEPAAQSQPEALIPSANGPDLWRAILAVMPVGSVIAGGAVRDYLLGVEPKDIDVFSDIAAERAMPSEADHNIVYSDPRFGLYRIENEYERFEEYAAVSNIACVSSGQLLGHRVDHVIIEGFTSGPELVAGFDFGLNRCWFDGEIHDTDEARHDRETRTATLLLTDRVERSATRFQRLNERWGGGWRYVVPASAIEARRAGTEGSGA